MLYSAAAAATSYEHASFVYSVCSLLSLVLSSRQPFETIWKCTETHFSTVSAANFIFVSFAQVWVIRLLLWPEIVFNIHMNDLLVRYTRMFLTLASSALSFYFTTYAFPSHFSPI